MAFSDVVVNDLARTARHRPEHDRDTAGPEAHPAPAHTGFRALVSETWSDFKEFPRRKSTWVILGIGAGGALLAHPQMTS
jgi:hypothetical protein